MKAQRQPFLLLRRDGLKQVVAPLRNGFDSPRSFAILLDLKPIGHSERLRAFFLHELIKISVLELRIAQELLDAHGLFLLNLEALLRCIRWRSVSEC